MMMGALQSLLPVDIFQADALQSAPSHRDHAPPSCGTDGFTLLRTYRLVLICELRVRNHLETQEKALLEETCSVMGDGAITLAYAAGW